MLLTWQASFNAKFRFSYSLLDEKLKDTQPNAYNDSLLSLVEDRSPNNQASLWGSFDLSSEVELDVRLFYVDERPFQFVNTEPVRSNLNADFRLAWYPSNTVELSLVGRNLLYSSRQEFVIETWPAASQIERSVFAKIKLDW